MAQVAQGARLLRGLKRRARLLSHRGQHAGHLTRQAVCGAPDGPLAATGHLPQLLVLRKVEPQPAQSRGSTHGTDARPCSTEFMKHVAPRLPSARYILPAADSALRAAAITTR